MSSENAPKIESLSEEQLNRIASDIFLNLVFTDRHIPENGEAAKVARVIFQPIATGFFDGWTEEELHSVGMIYQYIDKAQQHEHSDKYPVFAEIELLNIKDALFVFKKVQELQNESLEKEEE